MSKRRTDRTELSATQRKHLEAIEACERSGEPLKRYAERKRLSIHTLYQAKKELRKKGVLPPAARSRSKARKRSNEVEHTPRFVQAIPRNSQAAAVHPTWRLHLPTGVVFESTTAITPDEIARLVHALRSAS